MRGQRNDYAQASAAHYKSSQVVLAISSFDGEDATQPDGAIGPIPPRAEPLAECPVALELRRIRDGVLKCSGRKMAPGVRQVNEFPRPPHFAYERPESGVVFGVEKRARPASVMLGSRIAQRRCGDFEPERISRRYNNSLLITGKCCERNRVGVGNESEPPGSSQVWRPDVFGVPSAVGAYGESDGVGRAVVDRDTRSNDETPGVQSLVHAVDDDRVDARVQAARGGVSARGQNQSEAEGKAHVVWSGVGLPSGKMSRRVVAARRVSHAATPPTVYPICRRKNPCGDTTHSATSMTLSHVHRETQHLMASVPHARRLTDRPGARSALWRRSGGRRRGCGRR